MIETMEDALQLIFQTRRRLDGAPRGLDEDTRDTAPTRSLLEQLNLLDGERDYAVVTGSRGKGSVTTIMAKLLQSLGHRVGTITSPHLVHWNERIRVNGRMIPTADFLRIFNDMRPTIDAVTSRLNDEEYLSPQGIFLAVALRYFDEMKVDVAVLEVGRGGRFDDIAVVPNALSVFAPIMLEHTSLLGDTVERIAWHKAGIMKAGGRAISLPQTQSALSGLRREAAGKGAQLISLSDADLASWMADQPAGQLIHLPPYGELELPLLGRYQIENATLAIRAVDIDVRTCRQLGLDPYRGDPTWLGASPLARTGTEVGRLSGDLRRWRDHSPLGEVLHQQSRASPAASGCFDCRHSARSRLRRRIRGHGFSQPNARHHRDRYQSEHALPHAL